MRYWIGMLAVGIAFPAYAADDGGMASMPGMKPAPAASAAHGKSMSGMSGMSGMGGMSGMDMPSSIDILDPMSRESSGTAWIPDSSPMYGHMIMKGDNMIMVHGGIFPRFTEQGIGSRRGDHRFDAPSWFMGMASHPLDANSQLGFRLMMSLDPLIESERGYPLMYQSGESAHGMPLHDRQHPHDLFDELSVTYSRKFGAANSGYLYVGYPGEPALGPPTFMHRPSAMDDPDAPIGHHWQDSTHITFGVITAGVTHRNVKLEGSVFNGSEPDEYRYNFDPIKLNSYSGRVSWNPCKNLALAASYGFVKSPEALDPGVNVHRTTASLIYNKPLGADANWANSFVWGQNDESGSGKSNSFLLESDYQRGANTFYARLEQVEKSGHELVLPDPTLDNTLFSVGSYEAGYVRDLVHNSKAGLDLGLGGQVTVSPHPGGLDPFYGSNTPVGFQVFFRLRPSRMEFQPGAMSGMQGMSGMSGMKGGHGEGGSGGPGDMGTSGSSVISVEAVSAPPKVGQNTVSLTLTGPDGKPVQGAKIQSSVSMTTMNMGTTHPSFKDMGNGRYSGSVTFSMAGPWRVSLKILPGNREKPVQKDLEYNVGP